MLRRLTPADRGNLLIAAIPLALAFVTRGLDALERHVAARMQTLADLDRAIATAAGELAAIQSQFPTEPGTGDVDEDQVADIDKACAYCNDGTPAVRTTDHGVPICFDEHTAPGPGHPMAAAS